MGNIVEIWQCSSRAAEVKNEKSCACVLQKKVEGRMGKEVLAVVDKVLEHRSGVLHLVKS